MSESQKKKFEKIKKEEDKILGLLNKFQESVKKYKITRNFSNRLSVYADADNFTYNFLLYVVKKGQTNTGDQQYIFNDDTLLENLDKEFNNPDFLLNKLKDTNEQNNMYTEEKPNFALHLSIILYLPKYFKLFDPNNLYFIFSAFEQFGFTGIFGLKDKIRRDNIDFYKYYPEILFAMIEYKYPIHYKSTIYHEVTNIFTADLLYNKFEDNLPIIDPAKINKTKKKLILAQQRYISEKTFDIGLEIKLQKIRNAIKKFKETKTKTKTKKVRKNNPRNDRNRTRSRSRSRTRSRSRSRTRSRSRSRTRSRSRSKPIS